MTCRRRKKFLLCRSYSTGIHSIATILLVSRSWAQVDPANFANVNGAPKGAWGTPAGQGSRGPPVDCKGNWTGWTACSSETRQWRYFEPTRWSENSGKACPEPLAEERACVYPGPRLLYAAMTPTVPWSPRCGRRTDHCEWPVIKAAVNDSIVFVSPQGVSKVSRLASTWHYTNCDLTDAENLPLTLVATAQGVLSAQ